MFLYEKFFEMRAGTEKRHFCLCYGHKISIKVGVYFKQEIQLSI